MDRIVAAEVTALNAEIFVRDTAGKLSRQFMPFSPWCLAEKGVSVPEGAVETALSGTAPLNRRFEFSSLEVYENALPELKKTPGVLTVRDLSCQFFSTSNLRLFAGMDFNELVRMQFAVTVSADEKSVEAIEVSDNRGFAARFDIDNCGGELEILAAFNAAVKERDPDLIEGFNIFRTDLPFLEKRAKKLKFTFDCGRDGKGFSSRKSRFPVAEKQISCTRYALYGRHIIDIYHLLLFYDAVHRDFETFELEYLKSYFHIPENSGICDTVRELSALLLPASFYKCCTLPLNLQDAVLRGSGAALDALFIAEYQRAGASVPYPEEARRFAGALTGAGEAGVYHNVRHCDVRSLYPSLLLYLDRAPVRDELGIFLKLLRQLREFRLNAKDRAKAASGSEKQRFNALQNTFKILINSFYGYLGFAQGSFNDYALAETVTAAGREILSKLAQKLEALDAKILEMDTDGIYFTMPENSDSDFDMQIISVLPPGIELEFDAVYPAMYCYKAKNYALLNADGSISVSGAALKSRALENFQRRFIQCVLQAKLTGKPDLIETCYSELKTSITNRTIALSDLVKSEVLSDSPENYKRKQNTPGFRRSAPYELALASDKKFRAGDKVEFYVTGTKAKLPVVGNSKLLSDADPAVRDENSAYYLNKLDDLYNQFK
ncbi:MAG: hypothetical protein E7054_05330 [Lentisphaerae bacterium]|nr:hypothetical protein [Lentisphaerota bacterium]